MVKKRRKISRWIRALHPVVPAFSKVRGSGLLLPGLQMPPVWLSKGKRDELGVLGLRCTLGLPLSPLTHLPMFCLFLMESHIWDASVLFPFAQVPHVPPPPQSQQGTLPVPGAEQLGELGERMSGGHF